MQDEIFKYSSSGSLYNNLVPLLEGCCLLKAETAKTKRTEDGFELHMGVNFMGHFALVHHLLPLIRKTATEMSLDRDVRILAVASSAHALTGGPLNLHDLNWERKGTKSMIAYAHSKEHNALKLSLRLRVLWLWSFQILILCGFY